MKSCNDRFTSWALSKQLGSTQEDKLKAYPSDKKAYIVKTQGQVNRSQERSVRSTVRKTYDHWWSTCGCVEWKWIVDAE